MRGVVVLVLAGCAFKPTQVQPDAAQPGGVPGSIVEDTATDFGGRVSGGVIDPLGLIAPDTYVAGGLHARGFKQKGVDGNTDLNNLPNLGPSSGEMYGMPLAGNWPNNANTGKGESTFPLALGIGQNDNYTVLFDGEIQLPAGSTMLQVSVDDAAVFEITVAGTPVKLAATVGNDTTVMVTTPADGWYPIRGAFSEDGGDARLALNIVTTGAAAFPSNRLRARTTAVTGLQLGVFFASELQIGMLDGITPGPGYDPGPIDHAALVPLDYNLKGLYSIRYQGQLRVDADGMYTVSANVGPDADDHYRVFVDDQLVASHWLSITDVAPAPTHLAPGWHAVVVDYGDNLGNAEIHLDVDGAPIAADHLRPALVHGHVIASSPNNTPCTCPVGTTACAIGVLDTAPGATIDYVDVEYILTGPRDITATLNADTRSDPIPIHATPNETEFATQPYDYDAGHVMLAGLDDLVSWSMTVTAPTAAGTFASYVVLTTHGGPGAPFSPLVAYESLAHPLPDGATLDAVTVTGALGGAIVVIEVRTADDDASLAAAPYTPVGNGAAIAIAAGKLVQFRVSTTTDGWSFPTIDKVEIDYTTPAPTP